MSASPNTLPAVQTTARAALRSVTALVGTYLGISVLTVVVAVVFRDDPTIVNAAVWIRGSIVVITAALMFRFAIGAGRGHQRAYLRLRLVSAIMVVAIAVILAIPSDFPLWMKIEQALCGLVLVGVVILANRRGLRSMFSAAAPDRTASAAA